MKILDVEQGTPDWRMARLGIPTASQFHRILTPTGKLSAAADGYLHELIAERLMGVPFDTDASGFMERGNAMESQAVRYYEFQRECVAQKVGFVLGDGAGCSPDRLVGSDGGVEIKCPSAPVHVGYLLESLPKRFGPQVQGSLWITGRRWWDVLSYHPELPTALVRIERDEEYIAALATEVGEFAARLEAATGALSAYL